MLMFLERALRWSLVTVAMVGLAAGILVHLANQAGIAHLAWTLATIPVLLGLAASIVRDFLSGRVGVDAVALLSMATALLLGESLAGAVVALMYSGGNVLEDFAVFRAEHDLRSLVDRATAWHTVTSTTGLKMCRSRASQLATSSWFGRGRSFLSMGSST
jgi:cation transport ATPase